MQCQPADLVRAARRRHGLSQRRLALRAGTSQDAVSRVERGVESVTVERLERLLNVMGETLQLSVAALDSDVDAAELRHLRGLPPERRLAQAISWNRTASRFAEAGRRARAGAR